MRALLAFGIFCWFFSTVSAVAIVSPPPHSNLSLVTIFTMSCTSKEISDGGGFLSFLVNTIYNGDCYKCPCNVSLDTRNYADGNDVLNITFGSLFYPTQPHVNILENVWNGCLSTNNCSSHGTCTADGMRCVCQSNFNGTKCNSCAPGYGHYPTCDSLATCNPSTTCSGHGTCNSDGSCTCPVGYVQGGSADTYCPTCDYANGYVNFPVCSKGAVPLYFNVTPANGTSVAGQTGVHTVANGTGLTYVNYYIAGVEVFSNEWPYWGYDDTAFDFTSYPNGPINLTVQGEFDYKDNSRAYYSVVLILNVNNSCPGTNNCNQYRGTCDVNTNQCMCHVGYAGANCTKCAIGYFGYPNCVLGKDPCGDGVCDTSHETCQNCTADCGPCVFNCGDGACNQYAGEACYNCDADCGTCPVEVILPPDGSFVQGTLVPVTFRSNVGGLLDNDVLIDGNFVADQYASYGTTCFTPVSVTTTGQHEIAVYAGVNGYDGEEEGYEAVANFTTITSGPFFVNSPTGSDYNGSVHFSVALNANYAITSIQIYRLTGLYSTDVSLAATASGPPFTADISITDVTYGGVWFWIKGVDTTTGAVFLTAVSGISCTSATTCSGHGACVPEQGYCQCNDGFTSATCTDQCQYGGGISTFCNECDDDYYHYPTCKYCLASTTCNGHGTCSSTGNCVCTSGHTGAYCNVSGTAAPTAAPSHVPSKAPTSAPSPKPSKAPTGVPSQKPTSLPSLAPTLPPTATVVIMNRNSGMVVAASSFNPSATINLTAFNAAAGANQYQAWNFDNSTGYVTLQSHPNMIIGAGPAVENLSASATSVSYAFKLALVDRTAYPQDVNRWAYAPVPGTLYYGIKNVQLSGTWWDAPYPNTPATEPQSQVWSAPRNAGAYVQEFSFILTTCSSC